jgi:rhodanese-related sulfurtransferase
VALLLKQRGVERVRPLEGGFDAWRQRGFPLQNRSSSLTPFS